MVIGVGLSGALRVVGGAIPTTDVEGAGEVEVGASGVVSGAVVGGAVVVVVVGGTWFPQTHVFCTLSHSQPGGPAKAGRSHANTASPRAIRKKRRFTVAPGTDGSS